MDALVLIDSIVRQTTVLIGQLATSGGIRAPLANLANQVFLDLANELAAQGVSRKVSADMFGMALRAYVRKVKRLSAGQTEQGRTLWQAVLDFIKHEPLVTRDRVLQRFQYDGEIEVTAVLHDLQESGIVFCSGSGRSALYRAASDEELGQAARLADDTGLDELAWVLTYRNGPLTGEELAKLLRRDVATTEPILRRLADDGRLQAASGDRWVARDFVIPLGSAVGWEAAVFDHFQAVVQTISQRLRQASFDSDHRHAVGGSTYSFDVWSDHPLCDEVEGQLAQLRERLGELRQRVDDHNRREGMPREVQQVVTYVGQCVIDREIDAEEG